MTSPDKDPDDRNALENLVVVKEYFKHEGTWLDPQAAKDGAIKALGALYDQIAPLFEFAPDNCALPDGWKKEAIAKAEGRKE